MEIRILSILICIVLLLLLAPVGKAERIYVVSHGWHTGLVIPLEPVDEDVCPGLRMFEGWPFAEIGWGDEGFYRGGDSISLTVALKAVATPTPTVLHVVGVSSPVEEFFSQSEVVAIDLEPESFTALCQFVGATFESDADRMPMDLGSGIYGASRFFRARGSYYFPETCNVWTLRALKSAGLPVVPVVGIRAENVIAQAAAHGESIRRFPGRSRLSVLVAAVVAAGLAVMLRRKKRLTLIVWAVLIFSILCVAAATIAQINQMDVPVWLFSWAGWQCWGAVAMVAAAHAIALREKFRVRHVIALFVAIVVIVIGLSPL